MSCAVPVTTTAVHANLDREQRGDEPGGPVPGLVREGRRLVRRDLAEQRDQRVDRR